MTTWQSTAYLLGLTLALVQPQPTEFCSAGYGNPGASASSMQSCCWHSCKGARLRCDFFCMAALGKLCGHTSLERQEPSTAEAVLAAAEPRLQRKRDWLGCLMWWVGHSPQTVALRALATPWLPAPVLSMFGVHVAAGACHHRISVCC